MKAPMPQPAYHGGNLQDADALFGKPSDGWLDLSTGINGEPYPDIAVTASSLHCLPQQSSLDALLGAARRYYRVPASVAITAAPGSQSIIQVLPSLIPACRVAIVGQTYAEHRKTWTDYGHQVSIVQNLADARTANVTVVVNPNNPDGHLFRASALINHARTQTMKSDLLIVDEAFTDTVQEESIVPLLQNESALAIRSFGKFFGLAGLRLGFAIGAPDIVAALEHRLGPWAVAGPALEIGNRALRDDAWISTAHQQLTVRCKAVDQVLLDAGLSVTGGTLLFRFIVNDNASKLFERLGRAGIFTRVFSEQPTWLRIGVPASDADLRRLQKALS